MVLCTQAFPLEERGRMQGWGAGKGEEMEEEEEIEEDRREEGENFCRHQTLPMMHLTCQTLSVSCCISNIHLNTSCPCTNTSYLKCLAAYWNWGISRLLKFVWFLAMYPFKEEKKSTYITPQEFRGPWTWMVEKLNIFIYTNILFNMYFYLLWFVD